MIRRRAAPLCLASLLIVVGLLSGPAPTMGLTVYYADLDGMAIAGDPDGAGVARLTIDAGNQEVCWRLSVEQVDAASAIEIVNAGLSVIVTLDLTIVESLYQGCKPWPGAVLAPIVADPSSYRLRYSTPSLPSGALIGPLGAVDVVEWLHVGVYRCPDGIDSFAQAEAAGGLFVLCSAVGLPGDVAAPPPGYAYASPPLETDFDVRFDESGGGTWGLDVAQPTLGSIGDTACDPTPMECGLTHFYGFDDASTGETMVSLIGPPDGTSVASIGVFADGTSSLPADIDLPSRSATFDLEAEQSQVTVLFIVQAEPALVRRSGPDRYATAAAVSAGAFDPNVPVVYVATGTNFPDALGAGPAAADEGGPVLLVTRDTIPAATAIELGRLKPARIVVVGGTGVVSQAVFNALDAYLE